tara:strand:+ start:116 stop:319 length:204 start_codon:yes stop_codon:yes gene_type:complete
MNAEDKASNVVREITATLEKYGCTIECSSISSDYGSTLSVNLEDESGCVIHNFRIENADICSIPDTI